MLSDNEWRKLKDELNRNFKPIFDNAGIHYSLPFEIIIEIFKGLLEKEIGEPDLDDREDIIKALKIRYIDKNGNLYSQALIALAVKIESFYKRLYKIVDETLWTGENNQLKGQIVTFITKFKFNYADSDFASANLDVFKEFVKTDSNKKPIFVPDYFKDKLPFGKQFKSAYDIRNREGHLDPDLDDDTISILIKDIVTIYLFTVLKYADKLKIQILHEANESNITVWNKFRTYCNNFDKRQLYFLVTDKLNITKEQMQHFGNIDWAFVFDFDQQTDISGILSAIKSVYPKAIQTITHVSDDRNVIPILPPNTSFWYYANGIEGRSKSIPQTSNYSDWKLLYLRYTEDLLRTYYEYISIKPINVIILTNNKDYLSDILYSIKALNISVNFVFANNDNSNLSQLIQDYKGKNIEIPILQLVEGFRELNGQIFSIFSTGQIFLPCHTALGTTIELKKSEADLVKQYFQILHLNILNEPDNSISNKTYYQGRAITWHELDSNNVDVKRDITEPIIKKIRKWLENRSDSGIFYFYHDSGAGGTTVAKRVAYSLHQEFPVLFLNEDLITIDVTRVVENLLRVFHATELPVLVIIDNATINSTQINQLKQQAEYRLAKAVFLVTDSRFNEIPNNDNTFYLPLNLDKTSQEPYRFVQKFSNEFKEKENQFKELLGNEEPNHLTPFYFGLLAHEKEFITITKFVKVRIETLTAKQIEMLSFIAFCTIYAKNRFKEVPSVLIGHFLDISEQFVVLQKHIDNTNKLFDLIIETEPLHWRTLHPIIADEILGQVFGKNERGQLNPFKLLEFSRKLIGFAREISTLKNAEVLGLLYSLFIERNTFSNNLPNDNYTEDNYNTGIYNEKVFAKLITDLANNENRIEIFTELAKQFPTEQPHFWGHLARIHSYNKNHTEAIINIDKAIELGDEDNRLHHIKGMCYRSELMKLIDYYFGKSDIPQEIHSKIRDFFNKAEEKFFDVIEFNPTDEHGYISYIQMSISIIEFGFSISTYKKEKNYAGFIISDNAFWYRNILSTCSELINEFKNQNIDSQSHTRINELSIKLMKYYGEKEKMISSWNNILDKKEHDQNLVRRQLSYAYLAKYNFNWQDLKTKELEKIEDLISKNLLDKPLSKDIRLWFEAARKLNRTTKILIEKLLEYEFNKETPESAFYLFSLYTLSALEGSLSAVDNYNIYKGKCKQRISRPYSKIYCPEWIIYNQNNTLNLCDQKALGTWDKEKSFFTKLPDNLAKLKGKVSKYIDRAQGYIEIENTGIEALYQPGKINHFSSDIDRQVEFYVGFNFDGVRVFNVKNID